jgi:hypothetical protein
VTIETLSEQSVDIGRGDFCGPNEDDYECQRDNEKQWPENPVGNAAPNDIANQNPSVIESSHPLVSSNTT